MDAKDPLRAYRDQFYIPKADDGTECIYLSGNSLGLQPKKVREYVVEDLDDWAKYGVEGHFQAKHPWLPYHENLTEQTARLVGALPLEVVTMNTLTVNLHLMMVSFYRPTATRFKILVEAGAFPSDQYAVASQVRFHGYAPTEAIVELRPRPGEENLRTEDILEKISREGDEIALVLIGNVNYLTGQSFDMGAITRTAHAKGCRVGFDLAHGAGNLVLNLHDVGADFAVWCSYKYLNSGPGALAGCFVHERHARDPKLPRFSGWWGHDKATRFRMGPTFDPIPGAEGWQLSNPPIFQLAAMRASLEIFDSATIEALRAKSERLTGYLEFLLKRLASPKFKIVTPANSGERGSQLSLRVTDDAKGLTKKWIAGGVICDFREPDIIRVAPTALYNRFSEVYRFAEIMAAHLEHRS
jgi:kynureninase